MDPRLSDHPAGSIMVNVAFISVFAYIYMYIVMGERERVRHIRLE